MNIRQLVSLMLITSGLYCMDAPTITKDKLSLANEGEALTSFPDYMYYYSAWSNILSIKGLSIGSLATPLLQSAAQQIQDKYSKREFINMCATLLMVEATLLQKPFEEFTIEDIQKVNSFLTHGINDYNRDSGIEVLGKPGALRTGRTWLMQNGETQLSFEEKRALTSIKEKIDLHDEDELELSTLLTEQEYALYRKIFVETPPAPNVRIFLEAMLADAKDNYKNGIPLVAIAASLHVALTQIHPFSDGNGRTARLLINCLCMKAGRFPFIVIDGNLYAHSIKSGDEDAAYMRGYICTSSYKARQALTKNEVPYALSGNLANLDFSSIIFTNEYYHGPFKQIRKELKNHCYSQKSSNLPIKNLSKDDYQELLSIIATQYNALSPENSDFEQRVGDLKKFCLQALSMTDRLCSSCNKIESTKKLRACSRCKNALYCSELCQKKDWPLHKTICHPKQ